MSRRRSTPCTPEHLESSVGMPPHYTAYPSTPARRRRKAVLGITGSLIIAVAAFALISQIFYVHGSGSGSEKSVDWPGYDRRDLRSRTPYPPLDDSVGFPDVDSAVNAQVSGADDDRMGGLSSFDEGRHFRTTFLELKTWIISLFPSSLQTEKSRAAAEYKKIHGKMPSKAVEVWILRTCMGWLPESQVEMLVGAVKRHWRQLDTDANEHAVRDWIGYEKAMVSDVVFHFKEGVVQGSGAGKAMGGTLEDDSSGSSSSATAVSASSTLNGSVAKANVTGTATGNWSTTQATGPSSVSNATLSSATSSSAPLASSTSLGSSRRDNRGEAFTRGNAITQDDTIEHSGSKLLTREDRKLAARDVPAGHGSPELWKTTMAAAEYSVGRRDHVPSESVGLDQRSPSLERRGWFGKKKSSKSSPAKTSSSTRKPKTTMHTSVSAKPTTSLNNKVAGYSSGPTASSYASTPFATGAYPSENQYGQSTPTPTQNVDAYPGRTSFVASAFAAYPDDNAYGQPSDSTTRDVDAYPDPERTSFVTSATAAYGNDNAYAQPTASTTQDGDAYPDPDQTSFIKSPTATDPDDCGYEEPTPTPTEDLGVNSDPDRTSPVMRVTATGVDKEYKTIYDPDATSTASSVAAQGSCDQSEDPECTDNASPKPSKSANTQEAASSSGPSYDQRFTPPKSGGGAGNRGGVTQPDPDDGSGYKIRRRSPEQARKRSTDAAIEARTDALAAPSNQPKADEDKLASDLSSLTPDQARLRTEKVVAGRLRKAESLVKAAVKALQSGKDKANRKWQKLVKLLKDAMKPLKKADKELKAPHIIVTDPNGESTPYPRSARLKRSAELADDPQKPTDSTNSESAGERPGLSKRRGGGGGGRGGSSSSSGGGKSGSSSSSNGKGDSDGGSGLGGDVAGLAKDTLNGYLSSSNISIGTNNQVKTQSKMTVPAALALLSQAQAIYQMGGKFIKDLKQSDPNATPQTSESDSLMTEVVGLAEKVLGLGNRVVKAKKADSNGQSKNVVNGDNSASGTTDSATGSSDGTTLTKSDEPTTSDRVVTSTDTVQSRIKRSAQLGRRNNISWGEPIGNGERSVEIVSNMAARANEAAEHNTQSGRGPPERRDEAAVNSAPHATSPNKSPRSTSNIFPAKTPKTITAKIRAAKAHVIQAIKQLKAKLGSGIRKSFVYQWLRSMLNSAKKAEYFQTHPKATKLPKELQRSG